MRLPPSSNGPDKCIKAGLILRVALLARPRSDAAAPIDFPVKDAKADCISPSAGRRHEFDPFSISLSSTQSAGSDPSSLEPVHPVAAFREHAALDGVSDRAEAVELEFKGPLGPVEGFAPAKRTETSPIGCGCTNPSNVVPPSRRCGNS